MPNDYMQSLRSMVTDAIFIGALVYLAKAHVIDSVYVVMLFLLFAQSRYGVGLVKASGGVTPPNLPPGGSSGTSQPRMTAVIIPETPPRRDLRTTLLGWFSPNPMWILLVVASVLLYSFSFAKGMR